MNLSGLITFLATINRILKKPLNHCISSFAQKATLILFKLPALGSLSLTTQTAFGLTTLHTLIEETYLSVWIKTVNEITDMMKRRSIKLYYVSYIISV